LSSQVIETVTGGVSGALEQPVIEYRSALQPSAMTGIK
jgi:hypothetical protein